MKEVVYMGLDINNVAKALGISKKSAEALDALDGKSDKQVEQSIYDEAAKLLNAARTSKGDSSVFNFEFKEKVYNAIEGDISGILGYVKTDTKQDNIKDIPTMEEKEYTSVHIENADLSQVADLEDLPEGVTIDSNESVALQISPKMKTWAGIVQAYYPDLLES